MNNWFSVYDIKTHPSLLIQVMSQGYTMSGFCKEARIGIQTFYNWLDRNPEFAEAYEVAKQCKTEYFEQRLLDGIDSKDVNSPILIYASKAMGRVGKQIDLRGFDPEAPLEEQTAYILKALKEGRLDSEQAEQMMKILTSKMQIVDLPAMKAELAEIKELISHGNT